MQSINSIMPKIVRRAGISEKVISSQVIVLFEKIKEEFLPAELSSRVQAVYFENQILNIASLSTLATQDLTIKSENIIKKLNNLLEKEIVEKIKILA